LERNLTPLSLAGILDEAFDLYKRNFVLFVGIAAIIEAPSAIGLTLMTGMLEPPRGNSPEDVSKVLGVLFLMMMGFAVYGLFWIVQSGAQVMAASARYLGQPITIGEAYKRSIRSAPRLLGGWLAVFGLIMAIVFALAFIAAFFIAAISVGSRPDEAITGIFVIIIGVAIGVASVVIMAKWGVCLTPVICIEGVGAIQGLARSGQLVKGLVRRSFWLILAVYAMIYSVGMAVAYTFATIVVDLVYPRFGVSPTIATMTTQLIQQAFMIFMMPYLMSVYTVHYFDLRVRKEAFDLAFRASQMSVAPKIQPTEGLQLGEAL
jgi:hypothetical protein